MPFRAADIGPCFDEKNATSYVNAGSSGWPEMEAPTSNRVDPAQDAVNVGLFNCFKRQATSVVQTSRMPYFVGGPNKEMCARGSGAFDPGHEQNVFEPRTQGP